MDFVGKWKICLIISGSIFALALLLTLVGFGLNMGMDFTGGAIIEYDMGEEFKIEDVQSAVSALGVTDSDISKAGEGDVQRNVSVSLKEPGTPEEQVKFRGELLDNLRGAYPDIQYVKSDYVSASNGQRLISSEVQATLLAMLLILIYLAFRYDLFYGISAVFGALHDVLIMLSVMVILRAFAQVNSTFIAAILAVIGYSVTRSIIVFDRVREALNKPANRGRPHGEIINLAIGESAMRSINTTVVAFVMLTVLCILGVDSVRELALPLIIGILAGAYSSIFINGGTWAFLLDRSNRRKSQLQARRQAQKAAAKIKAEKQPQ